MTDQQPSSTLRAEVRDLRQAVTGLAALLDEKVQTKVEAEVHDKAIPREEFTARVRASGRRTVAGMVVLLLLLALAVSTNRYTLLQAQRDLNNQIVRCFLRPGDNTPAQAKACEDRFGNGYIETQQRSRDATADFADLRKWAKARGWEPPSEACRPGKICVKRLP